VSGCRPRPDRKAVSCLPQLSRRPSFTKFGVRKAGYALSGFRQFVLDAIGDAAVFVTSPVAVNGGQTA
jgi:hypothetical protein